MSFYLSKYVHGDHESFYPWELDPEGNVRNPEVSELLHYLAYEVELVYEVEGTRAFLRYVGDGGDWLPEKPGDEILQEARARGRAI